MQLMAVVDLLDLLACWSRSLCMLHAMVEMQVLMAQWLAMNQMRIQLLLREMLLILSLRPLAFAIGTPMCGFFA